MIIYDMEASGKRLKTLRKQAEKTQEQVAEAVGLEPGTISRIERGVKGMSIDSLLMFSEIYGVSTDYILKVTMQTDENGRFSDIEKKFLRIKECN